MVHQKKLVILISGRGSNMQAIIQACATEHWSTQISGVISDRPEAPGLSLAAEYHLNTAVVDARLYDRTQFEAELIQTIDRFSADLVILAGFMRILSPSFVKRYTVFNIHPSLLPSFPGLNTHQRALKAGVKLHGATVHFVTPELDEGPIIAQAAVPVYPKDTVETLAARVLIAEHQLYPQAIRWYMNDRIVLDGNHVHLTSPEPQWQMIDC